MGRKKTMIVNESAGTQQQVQKLFSRGVMSLSGQRPGPASWALFGGTLAQPQLLGKRS